jgi:hypothetical protein
VRYGRRGYELQLLGKILKSKGVFDIPADITERYALAASIGMHWQCMCIR